MEATTLLRSSSPFLKPSNFISKSSFPPSNRPEFLCFSTTSRSSNRWNKHCHSISVPKHGERRFVVGGRRNSVVRASSAVGGGGSSFDSDSPIAPLQLESPVGQFLSQILKSHPHLLPAAVDQQLQQLQTDRDAEKQKEDPSTAGTDLVLYRRIAEVKAKDRKKAVEEILYALVVQKFVDANVSLIPSVSSTPTDPSGRVDSWPSQEEKVVQLHSVEAFEMIENHLSLILGNRLEDSNSLAQISKLRVGHVYAASVMYGYFLRRVDQRFQLEKTMKVLPQGLDKEDNEIVQSLGGEEMRKSVGSEEYSRAEQVPSHPEVSSWSGSFGEDGFGNRIKASRLRNYVMNFDGETLQRYATARSKEAVSIIEKHTEALFGRPEIVITPEGVSSKDELIKISFGGLKRLVLEAVTFGSFLWDVESYVDSRYHFVTN